FDGRLREKLTDDGVEQTLSSLHRQISRYVSSDRPIWSSSADSASFLGLVDQLTAAVRDWGSLVGDKSVSSCLSRAEDLLQQSMFRLEDEFRTLVERGAESFDLTGPDSTYPTPYFSDDEDEEEEDDDDEGGAFIPVAQPVTNYNIIIDALPAGTIGELNEIAKRMVLAGYVKECSHAYSTCRREFLEESFSRLGLQKLSIDEVHKMQWPEVSDEIDKWMKSINVALRILFPSERRLCDRVFMGSPSAADLSFMEVCRGSAIQLLHFADAVAILSRAPDRLFKVLDVYETLRNLMPEFELVFSDQYCISLRNEAINIWKRLGEAVQGIFMELENSIQRDPVKGAVPGGALHPITRYVMNYLRAACRSLQTLEQIFEESVVDYRKGCDQALPSSSSLASQMAWIMQFLERNLEAKSKIYKDAALSSVFMMNNGKYMVQKVKDSELGTLLGEDWIRKHTARVRQYQTNYQKYSWSKIAGVLKSDYTPLPPNEAFKEYKEKLKFFNSHFEEIWKTQSSWVIFDDQLREELRGSISAMLCPPYKNFVARFYTVIDSGKNADRYVRYSADDIAARISELFQDGNNGRR
ncbi:hypothetical protein M569_02478, partial [Genlisea aurea]